MSLQTMLARADAREAERLWREHRRHCPACDRRAGGNAGELCTSGALLHSDMRETAATLKRELELDRQPPPGTEPLF